MCVGAGRCAGSGLLPPADPGAASPAEPAQPRTAPRAWSAAAGWEIFHLEEILFLFVKVQMELPDSFERRSSQDAE